MVDFVVRVPREPMEEDPSDFLAHAFAKSPSSERLLASFFLAEGETLNVCAEFVGPTVLLFVEVTFADLRPA